MSPSDPNAPSDLDRPVPPAPFAPLAVVGLDCAVPGASSVEEFERLLFEGRVGYSRVPDDRFDRALYYDAEKGKPGRAYTQLGGCVAELPSAAGQPHDPTHTRFVDVARRAWRRSGLSIDAFARTGVYVGHSGGTKFGGPLCLADTIEEAAAILRAGENELSHLPADVRDAAAAQLMADMRAERPSRNAGQNLWYDAYAAASLTATSLGLTGPRQVIDAACASSLVALQQAALAIWGGRIDAAIVGGATYNAVDNLILFSQSQACGTEASRPFDRRAGGLISSEGYVAIVVMPLDRAEREGRTVHGVLTSLGVSSDGRGRSLWAPRKEGQTLAIRRADRGSAPPLDIDTLECHATSTSLGDATELEGVGELIREAGRDEPLPIGSAKSNLGHTLEAAGLIGLVKTLLAMHRGERAPSVGFEQPSDRVDWSTLPLRVLTEPEPWRPRGESRTAAVSAFGIGGLNAHVRVRETAAGLREHSRAPLPNEPIAIVGRGVVLPESFDVPSLAAFLRSGRSAIAAPPTGRWIGPTGDDGGRGGWIDGYTFDARKYLVPPKQVAQANPVQFMLLDAMAQAARELGADDLIGKPGVPWPTDRLRTGVVVGAKFGGEFSNQLQLGLRLPEIQQRLIHLLDDRGLDDPERYAASLARQILDARPALLDETGSFTASTLASRMAKTYDLMGGAAALDAGDASDAAALLVAADQLRSGTLDTVVVGTARRAMDRAARAAMCQAGQLLPSGRVDDLPSDLSQTIPGEGVGVVALRRLKDAIADGQTVFGVLDAIELSDDPAPVDETDRRLAASIGTLHGSQALLKLIVETLRLETPTRITATSEDGVCIAATLRPHSTDNGKPTTDSGKPKPTGRDVVRVFKPPVAAASSPRPAELRPPQAHPAEPRPAAPRPAAPRPALPSVSRMNSSDSSSNAASLRFEAATAADLLDAVAADRRVPAFGDAAAAPFRAIAADDAGREAVRKSLARGKTVAALPRERAILFQVRPGSLARTAWLFPGQGSQSDGRPAIFDTADGRDVLAAFDAALPTHNAQPLSDWAAAAGQTRDIARTQWWTLAVSDAIARSLRSRGFRPDAVLGHSFGECSAAVAAGSLSLNAAIDLAARRADAIAVAAPSGGGLLSVRGRASAVAEAIAGFDGVSISHLNAGGQTLLSGSADRLKAVSESLAAANLPSLTVPVAAAFHSPALARAEDLLRRQLGSLAVAPPTCGFLSATSLRFLAEPSDLRESLIAQLTQPVLFGPAIERLAETAAIAVEVGPGDVLTRLTRETAGDRVLCLATGGDLDAAAELLGWAEEIAQPSAATMPRSKAPVHVPAQPAAPKRTGRVEVIDVATAAAPAAKTSPTPVALLAEPTPVEPPAEPAAREPAAPAQSVETVRLFLRDLVVELTGYDPEVVDFDADLEADLGVDSIKKAQLVGEMAAWLGLTEAPAGLDLDQVRTLDQIAALVADLDSPPPAADAPPAVAAQPNPPAKRDESSAASNEAGLTADAIDRLLVELVVDQTGYDPDVVDLDADLEADLGVDSIKQAQLLGELASHFDLASRLQAGGPTPQAIEFRTLRQLRDFVLEHLGDLPAADESETRDGSGGPSPDPFRRPDDSGLTPNGHINGRTNGHAGNGRASVIDVRRDAARPAATTEAAGESATAARDVIGHAPTDAVPAAILNRLQSGDAARSEVRGALQTLVGRFEAPGKTDQDENAFAELAKQTGVQPVSLAAAASLVEDDAPSAIEDDAEPCLPPSSQTVRFGLTTVPAPQRDGMPQVPPLSGPALVLGHGDLAEAIAEAVMNAGQTAYLLGVDHEDDVEAKLDEIWADGFTPHLFLATPHDADRMLTLSASKWAERRQRAIKVPFRLCQLWMTHAIDNGLIDRCTVVALLSLGGRYGFDGRAESFEGGGVGALVKAMLIEAWMRGAKTTPMKVIDVAPQAEPSAVAAAAMAELAVPSYDLETATDGRTRRAVQAVAKPLTTADRPKRTITRGGTWVISGGARGITALCAMELAERHDLTLWLLGTAPAPAVTIAQREGYATDATALRRQTMQSAIAAGENGVEAWRNLEKAIEIDRTLQECERRGIAASYRSVDVSDADAVAAVLDEIRRTDGKIHGVLHGAGAGQDARFDRKRPDKVEKCIAAKVDGCLALAAATERDDLEWFVGFGSISGRFGANGHTDYSLANDMLAKTIGLLGTKRPQTAAVTFHWHAWGDVGMATKPEAKLALEMIDMEFMPAAEGIAHFLAELEHGGHEPEALITDRRYYRKFFPTDRIADGGGDDALPLLGDHTPHAEPVLRLHPKTDAFLVEHRVGDVPTLPIAVAVEAMAQAAKARGGGRVVVQGRHLEARQALKFASPDPLAATVRTKVSGDAVACSLRADIRRRDGRLVAEDREFFRGGFLLADALPDRSAERPSLDGLDWHTIDYPDDPKAAPIYHGPPLRRLLKVAAKPEPAGDTLVGLIAGPANVELFGDRRPGRGWLTVPAVTDACLYAAAVFAYGQSGRPSLPVKFDRLTLGRPSDPGEPCVVQVSLMESDEKGAALRWTLYGQNGDVLLKAENYRIAWIG